MSDFAYPLHEECGVFGIYDRAGTEDVAAAAYSALYALQHRGQESCGIAVNDDGVITGHRDAAGHLHGSQQSVQAIHRAALHGDADDRQGGVGGKSTC